MASQPQEIAAGVYWLPISSPSGCNVYFVRSASSWTLIDAAAASHGQLILRTAEALFGSSAPPAAILLTHIHPDHTGSVRELARTWDCPAYVHPDELPLAAPRDLSTLEQYANPLDHWVILPLLRVMPRRRLQSILSSASLEDVVRAFDPGAPVPGLPDWTCIPTPGHSPGHVVFFRESDRVLIAGDALLTVDLNSLWGFLSWSLRAGKPRVSGPPWYTSWNQRAAKTSIAALAWLEPRVLASGHGIPMAGAAAARGLRAFSDRFARGQAIVGPPSAG